MKRAFRLRQSSEFTRVRRDGKSFSHPLVVLVAMDNPLGTIRVGVTAGRAVGAAVQRNRTKRQLRAAIDRLLPRIKPGSDMIFIARTPIREAKFDQILAGVHSVLARAGRLQQESAELNDRERISP